MTPVNPGRLFVRRTARTAAHLGHDEAVGLGHERVAPGAEGELDVGAIELNRVDVEAAGVHCLVFQNEQPKNDSTMSTLGTKQNKFIYLDKCLP